MPIPIFERNKCNTPYIYTKRRCIVSFSFSFFFSKIWESSQFKSILYLEVKMLKKRTREVSNNEENFLSHNVKLKIKYNKI